MHEYGDGSDAISEHHYDDGNNSNDVDDDGDISMIMYSKDTFDSYDYNGSSVNLRSIIASNISIRFISPLLSSNTCNNIVYLNLSFNRLEHVFPDISHMRQLQHLDISHNKITSIHNIKFNTKLVVLRCNNNPIHSIQCLSYLSNISELWLSYTRLKWNEYVYLLILKKLNTLVTSSSLSLSPSSSMLHANSSSSGSSSNGEASDDKYIDFFVSLLPSLSNLNGNSVVFSAAEVISYARSNDGKHLINRIRNKLSVEERNIFHFPTNDITINSGSNSTHSLQLDSESTSVAYNPYNSNNVTSTSSITSNSTITTTATTKNKKGRKKYNSDVSGISIANFKVKKHDNLELSPRDNSDDTYTSNKGNQQVPSKLIRFGISDDSPVCLCNYPDGTGYVRWSKGGAVACSMENGRLFSSYRTGAIACILDTLGVGSVMDHTGKCVLLLSSNNVAKVMNKQGNVIKIYNKKDSSKDGSDELTSGDTSNELSAYTSGVDDNGDKPHSWFHDGLKIVFNPQSWELLVVVKNEKVKCQYSSISGGSIIDESSLSPAKSNSLTTASNKAGGGNVRLKELDAQQHLQVRNDLKDVVSGLDSIIVKMKAI